MFTKIHNKRNQKGFTLIELLIVAIIVAILAALAIPRFIEASKKNKQNEAKELLKQIYTMQRAFRQEFDHYACNGGVASRHNPNAFDSILVEIPKNARYRYEMSVTSPYAFSCTATANIDCDAVGDEWRIDQDGDLINTSNDVRY